MPFMQAPNSRSRQNSNQNSQGTPPAGPQPHPQMPQRVTRDASKSPFGGLPTKARQKGKGCARSRAKASTAKGIEPEAPSRTPTRRKRATRVGDMQKAAGDVARMASRHRGCEPGGPEREKAARPPRGPAARLPSRGSGKPRKRKRGASQVPLSQVHLSRLPAPSPRNAPRGPAAPYSPTGSPLQYPRRWPA